MPRLLILSDGKPGHLNQSIAFAQHLGYAYDICPVRFKSRFAKVLSYVADRFLLKIARLFVCQPADENYRAIVSAGSETYYANRVLAARLQCQSIAIMLPRGYRYNFDLIIAQQHDNPPVRPHILSLPINLTYVEPQGLVVPEPGRKYVAIIVGGKSQHAQLDADFLRRQLTQIFAQFPEHGFWLTTSRRTPAEVETMLQEFSWARAVYFSQEQSNPIADYLQHSDYVFLTADSTSMISEAVSFGQACVEVLPLSSVPLEKGKLQRMLAQLEANRSLHRFTGQIGAASGKVNLAADYLQHLKL